tara:strand:- start:448 stop:735 length:288 start_codon:yes stop_codon:yes gene_type:complete
VDEYYKKDNINKLLDSIGDIGMEIIHYDEMEYCSLTEKYVIQDKSVKKGRKSISGSTARKMLKEGISPPDWFMRSEVSDLILNSLNEEKFVFVED